MAPFALSSDDLTIYNKDSFDYWVYHDPGPPPTIGGTLSNNYKWAHSLVAIWSAHLDPTQGKGAEMIDISNFKELKNKFKIMSVPAIIIDDSEVHFGAKSLDSIADLLK